MYLKGFIFLKIPLVFFLLKYYTKEMMKSSYYILCKITSCNAGDLDLIPGLGGSLGEGKGYPLQHSGLENSMDFMVHGVTKSWTWQNNFHLKNWMNTLVQSCRKSSSFQYRTGKRTACILIVSFRYESHLSYKLY